MSFIISTDDLRSIKTERALFAAMFSLLENLNFKKLTVKGICEEALISRAAFYAHFVDKYDLLKHWIDNICSKTCESGDIFNQLKVLLEPGQNKNLRIIKNLLYDACSETLEIIFNFLLSTRALTVDKCKDKDLYSKNVILSNFYAGGIISYLLWQIRSGFPSEVPIINDDLCKTINDFLNTQTK